MKFLNDNLFEFYFLYFMHLGFSSNVHLISSFMSIKHNLYNVHCRSRVFQVY